MGLGKFLKKAAGFALPVLGTLAAPGIGTALGSTLGTAALSGIGGALGGAAGGAIGGGGLSDALRGAALGGAGGYLAGGGLSDLLSGTSLGNAFGLGGQGVTADGLQVGQLYDSAAADAARSAASGAAATPSSTLPWLSASGGGGAAGGGTFAGFFKDPVGAVKGGLSDVITPSSLAKGGLKYGLGYALANGNSGGYQALQDAAARGAAGYSPYTAPGAKAAGALADLSGVNGKDAAAAAMANFQASPGYDFARSQGIKALDASAARRGLLLSGNQEQAVQDYGTGLANQYYQQYLQNLQNQASLGANAQGAQNQGGIDAATAYAALKGGNANRYNQMLAGLSNFF